MTVQMPQAFGQVVHVQIKPLACTHRSSCEE
jgi:hypothetical protein